MTQLLISVTNVHEASISLAHGADIIDLKEPSVGALGALPIETVIEVVKFVDGVKPVSATVGDLVIETNAQIQVLTDRVLALVEANVDYIKIGFFGAKDYQPCLLALNNLIKMCLPKSVKLIAVLFAECAYSAHLIKEIQAAGFVGLMIDTAQKNGKIYSNYQSDKVTKSFAKQARALHLSFGLAGSLNISSIENAKVFEPDYLGFRGGVCDENIRHAKLNLHKIREIRRLL